MHINLQIELFLTQRGMPATKFGRLAAGDPRLVLDIRNGREIGEPLQNRLIGFISGYDAACHQGQTDDG